MQNLLWTWILNQSINRRGYRVEPGTRLIAVIGMAVAIVLLAGMVVLVWLVLRA
jgi:hypothetical protein